MIVLTLLARGMSASPVATAAILVVVVAVPAVRAAGRAIARSAPVRSLVRGLATAAVPSFVLASLPAEQKILLVIELLDALLLQIFAEGNESVAGGVKATRAEPVVDQQRRVAQVQQIVRSRVQQI